MRLGVSKTFLLAATFVVRRSYGSSASGSSRTVAVDADGQVSDVVTDAANREVTEVDVQRSCKCLEGHSYCHSDGWCYRSALSYSFSFSCFGTCTASSELNGSGDDQECSCSAAYPLCHSDGWCYNTAASLTAHSISYIDCHGTCVHSFTDSGNPVNCASAEYSAIYEPAEQHRVYGAGYDYLKAQIDNQILDIYKPRVVLGTPGPIIIAVPGSGATKDDYFYRHHHWPNLASYGFTVAAINYRNYFWAHLTETYPETAGWAYVYHAVEDIKKAIGWVRKESRSLGVDPNKIILWGHSAGGMTNANFVLNRWGEQHAMDVGSVAALVVVSGSFTPMRWWEFGWSARSNGSELPPSYWTFYANETMPFVESLASIRHLKSMYPPADVEYRILPGSGHVGNWPGARTPEMDDIVRWLKLKLGICPPAISAARSRLAPKL